MNPKTPSSVDPASGKQVPGERLTQLLKALRQASLEIHSELRECLKAEGNIHMSPPPQAHIRRTQQLEKAYELFRQAEAKLDLLVSYFGGSL